MPSPQFVHLHLHTQYSLLDGAIRHAPLFERAKALGMPAVAMTDHGNLFGAVEFYEKALASGVKPILGCEVYLADGSRFDKERRERTESGFDAISHLLLLAQDETGYRNLLHLVSKAYLEGFYYRPRIDMDLLRERSEGLIATSGCLSSLVCRAILDDRPDAAWQLVEEFAEIFKDRFYLELQRHGIPEQDRVNAELVRMSSDLRLPLVATNDAHYLDCEDHAAHEALLCVGTGSTLDDPRRFRFTGQGFYLKSGQQMAELFHDHPSAVSNAMEIAERCKVEIGMGQMHLPEFQVPAGTTRERVLEEQAWAGLRRRLELEADAPLTGRYAEYEARMKHELHVIQSMKYAGYFLIVADFIDYARRNGIPVGPGRGSSAGSLVAYSLGVTGIDPIEYDIIFERFLNPERVSMPDIDVDFCIRGRDQVIRYVADRYDGEGDDGKRVAQIITFGKLQARAAVRDVGRVLGMSYGEVDRLAKLIPETLGITLDQALSQSPELRARIEADGRVKQLFDFARRLEGLTRHASTHAAGVVIANQPLIELVPLYRDSRSGDVITQWDMRCVEKTGLIKFDFLGLKTLTVIADAERQIRERRDPAFDIERIPLEDPKTYELLGRGDTEGVFQVESPGMTELTVKLKPRTFKELIPIVALYRPGPLGSGMVEDYVNRKHGLTRVEYLLPELEELTAETLGVIVYQDQVLQIANRLAGYSLGEADLLRRAMGKKKPAEMEKQRERFIAGCRERQIDPKKAEEVFNLMAEFAGYGFAKSHAAAYALITYQTAYLKANHPREFLAALLTNDSSNHKKLARYIARAREQSIPVLPPCVNESARDFTVVDEGVRFGLGGVKHVGDGAIDAILSARQGGEAAAQRGAAERRQAPARQGGEAAAQRGAAERRQAPARSGPFRGLFDFARRVDGRRVNRRALESLIKCGALDALHPNRAAAWASLDMVLESGASAQRDREIGQESLFAASTREAAAEPPLREVAEWTERERLAGEKEVLGFYVTGHPLDSVAPELARYAEVTSTAVEGREGREVRAGGLITGLRETRTRRGDLMSFGTLEDLEGSFDLVIFAEPYARLGRLLKQAASGDGIGSPIPLIVSGTLEVAETPKILVRDAFKLEEAEEKLSVQLRVRVTADEATVDRLSALRGVLESSPGDCAVFLHLAIPGESETILAVSEVRGVRPEPQLLRDVDALFGRAVTELSL